MKIENAKARFDYEIVDEFTAGMVLDGWEVKSIRAGHANLKSSWVTIREDEAWIENFSISPWKFSQAEQIAKKPRKLLLKKREIAKLNSKFKEKSFTLVPLKIFNQRGFLKCVVAIAKGRKNYQKRQVLKDRVTERTAQRAMKQY